MAQEITYVVFVNSICSQSRCKSASQVVPDNSSWNGFPKRNLRTRARFFEPPPQRIVVHLIDVLVKNELIRCSVTTETEKRIPDPTVHRNKPVFVSLA